MTRHKTTRVVRRSCLIRRRPLVAFFLACLCHTQLIVSTHDPVVNASLTGEGEHQLQISCNGSQVVNLGDYDVVVVGAGLSGAVLAQQHFEILQKKVLVLEKRDHLAGNTYDFVNEFGIRISRYGPHLFHTSSKRVWEYVQRFANWTNYEHRVMGKVDGIFVPIPVNILTVNALLEERLQSESDMKKWLANNQILPSTQQSTPPMQAATHSASEHIHNDSQVSDVYIDSSGHVKNLTGETAAKARVGQLLFDKIFREYTIKQWNRKAAWMAPSVLERIPVHIGFEDRYFPADTYQGLPVNGYTNFVHQILTSSISNSVGVISPNSNTTPHRHSDAKIDICLSTDFFDAISTTMKHAWLRDGPERRLFFTGPIDRYFSDAGLPPLEYRSIRFEMTNLPNTNFFQPMPVINYPQLADGNFTRIVEYKHFEWLGQALTNQARDSAGNLDSILSTTGTTIVKEFSCDKGEPYYPIPDQRNQQLYKRYQRLAEKEERMGRTHFVGRLANYKYINMDEAIANALLTFDRLYNIPKARQSANDDPVRENTVNTNARKKITIIISHCNESYHWLQEIMPKVVTVHSDHRKPRMGFFFEFIVYEHCSAVGSNIERPYQQTQLEHQRKRIIASCREKSYCTLFFVQANALRDAPMFASGIQNFLMSAAGSGFGHLNVFLPWGHVDAFAVNLTSQLASQIEQITSNEGEIQESIPCHSEQEPSSRLGLILGFPRSVATNKPNFEVPDNHQLNGTDATSTAQPTYILLSEMCLRRLTSRYFTSSNAFGEFPQRTLPTTH